MKLGKLLFLLGLWLMILGVSAAVCATSGFISWTVVFYGVFALVLLGVVAVVVLYAAAKKGPRAESVTNTNVSEGQ